MNLFLNGLFLITCYPILFIIYFMLRKAYDKNGYCFGASLKRELREDEAVKKIVAEYQTELKKSMIILAVVILPAFFIPWVSICMTLWMMWLLIVSFFPSYWLAKGNAKIRELKKERGWEESCEIKKLHSINEAYEPKRTIADATDDDNNWIFGMLYHNKKDKHIMVENRMGTGMAMNVATPVGKGLYLVSAILLLIIPVMCIWMILLEFTPLSTTVESDSIVCRQLGIEYEILLDDITEYTVITELPELIKVRGTGMDNILIGTYEIYREGMFETFLNPQNNLFIKIVTEEESYYLSGVDDVATQKIIEEIRFAKSE